MLSILAIDSLGKWPGSIAQNEKKNKDNSLVFEHLYRVKKTLNKA
jgi:hypothetical protein